MNQEKQKVPESYEELIKMVGLEKFAERLDQLIETANKFLEDAGYIETMECNQRIMLQVLLDYYTDIFRLKEFHDIKKIRPEKIAAYTIAWIVKRKPLQFIKNSDEEKDIFANERFAAFMFMQECLFSGECHFVSKELNDKVIEYTNTLLYYFKYRECNPKILEFAMESFKMGTLIKNK